jgi:MATE family multidrug resistance protein
VVVKLVASILPIVGLFQVFDGWAAVTSGVLRAKGKQVPTFCWYLFFFFSKLLNKILPLVFGCLIKSEVNFDHFTSRTTFNSDVITNSAYYVIGLPLGIYLAFRWHLGIHGLWIGLTISLIYCSTVGSWICFRTDWNKEVMKVIERLKLDDQTRWDVQEREGPLQ